MSKKVLIIGKHPVVDDVKRQYETRGWTVSQADPTAEDIEIGGVDELFLTPEYCTDQQQ